MKPSQLIIALTALSVVAACNSNKAQRTDKVSTTAEGAKDDKRIASGQTSDVEKKQTTEEADLETGKENKDQTTAQTGTYPAPGTGEFKEGEWHLTFKHLDTSSIGLDKEGMNFGLAKALNSVSQVGEIVQLEELPEGLSYSVDPKAFGLTSSQQNAVQNCPHLKSTNVEINGAQKPFWEADSFMYCILEPRIYYQFMGVARAGNMEVQTERLHLQTQRADGNHTIVGVVDSEVAHGNPRLMERIERPDGRVYWGTGDYRLPNGIRSAMASGTFPAQNAGRVGQLKAGEFMWTMDNGMIGFALSGFGAQARYEANINVASDPARDDGLVIAGYGCMNCHTTGYNAGTYTSDVGQGTATAHYASEQEYLALIEKDNAVYIDAMMKMGYSKETVMGTEPVTAIITAFEKRTGTRFVPGDATGALSGQ